MSGSVANRDYWLTHTPAGDGIERIVGTVDGFCARGMAFWHPEALMWRVVLCDYRGATSMERECSTMVDACHAVRDMHRAWVQ